MDNDEQTQLFTVHDLIAFAEWFNIKQWQGGKGDPQKIMFCKNDYVGIVKLFMKQKNNYDHPPTLPKPAGAVQDAGD